MAHSTRSRSGSVQLDDIKELIVGLEKRLTSKISEVMDRIETLEQKVDSITSHQITVDQDVTSIKQIIARQQAFIEKIEEEKREKNVIIQGVPENTLKIEDQGLEDDEEKISYLLKVMDPKKEMCGFKSFRIGKTIPGKPRRLLVKFEVKDNRDIFLFRQKELRTSDLCQKHFGTLYVNKDLSFLMRKEEKRLREKIKKMRASLSEEDRLYVKNKKLYLNQQIVDSIDISRQLF